MQICIYLQYTMNTDHQNILEKVNGFEWDKGNVDKNWNQHKVSFLECEEIFFNEPLIVEYDISHSKLEKRYFVLGKTDFNRLLFLVFTIRNDKIRVISARDMNRKERRSYNEKT